MQQSWSRKPVLYVDHFQVRPRTQTVTLPQHRRQLLAKSSAVEELEVPSEALHGTRIASGGVSASPVERGHRAGSRDRNAPYRVLG